METETLAEQTEQPDRQPYSPPVLEEYGDLNELTHGAFGRYTDPIGGIPYNYPTG